MCDQIAAVELQGLQSECTMEAGSIAGTAVLRDLTVHDLCSDGPGVSSIMVRVWEKGETVVP
jgi:hypothetical protein